MTQIVPWGEVEVGRDGPFRPSHCTGQLLHLFLWVSLHPHVKGNPWEPGTCSLVQRMAVTGYTLETVHIHLACEFHSRPLEETPTRLTSEGWGRETPPPFTSKVSASVPFLTGCLWHRQPVRSLHSLHTPRKGWVEPRRPLPTPLGASWELVLMECLCNRLESGPKLHTPHEGWKGPPSLTLRPFPGHQRVGANSKNVCYIGIDSQVTRSLGVGGDAWKRQPLKLPHRNCIGSLPANVKSDLQPDPILGLGVRDHRSQQASLFRLICFIIVLCGVVLYGGRGLVKHLQQQLCILNKQSTDFLYIKDLLTPCQNQDSELC